jgi:hypothetical protein
VVEDLDGVGAEEVGDAFLVDACGVAMGAIEQRRGAGRGAARGDERSSCGGGRRRETGTHISRGWLR